MDRVKNRVRAKDWTQNQAILSRANPMGREPDQQAACALSNLYFTTLFAETYLENCSWHFLLTPKDCGVKKYSNDTLN